MNATTNFVTSSQAGKILGLSTTTIQTLVNQKVLQSWRTYGGHRRISMASIRQYVDHGRIKSKNSESEFRIFKVLAMLEDKKYLARLDYHCRNKMQFELQIVNSFADALIKLRSEEVNLLIIELSEHFAAQKTMLQLLKDFTRTPSMNLILITNESKLITETSAIATNIQLFLSNSLSIEWIDGFIACMQCRL